MLATNPPRAMLATLSVTLLLLISTLSSSASAYNPNLPHYGAGRRIPMSSLKTLTFYSDKRTAYRRTSPLPQLTCVGAPCKRFQPDVVQCQSMGDGQWKCSADLPSSIRMGRVEVSCEGYDYADDPFVLKDSCALEYKLLDSGRERDDPWKKHHRGGAERKGTLEKLVERLFFLVFFGVAAAIVIGFIRSVMRDVRGTNAANRGGGNGGGWGGGPGGGGGWWSGGWNAPPPPYSAKPEPGTDTSSSSSSGWRPGFWTGLGLGGLAGTAAANLGSRPSGYGYGATSPFHHHHDHHDYGFAAGPSFRRPTRGWDNDDRGVGSSNGGGLREATGFGGTRNR